jgi:TonB family protein
MSCRGAAKATIDPSLKVLNARNGPVLAPEDDSRALDALRFSLASDIVELVVLTADDAFLQTLREAAGPTRRLWHVLSPDKVSDLLVAGGVGILVLDVQSLHEAPPRFIIEIKRQFPDLVVVVAGNREAETQLARLISDGSVYRFIHKPVSPARARLFAEAAVKRHDEQRRRAGAAEIPARAMPRKRAPLLVGAGCAAGCVLLVSLWLARRGPDEAAPPAVAPETPAPPPAAPSGTDVREQLLARAENALLEERLDEAAEAIDAARKAGAPSGRVAFLSAQLARARERLKTAATLAHPRVEAPADAADTRPAAIPIPPAERSAALAMARIQEDRLVEPDEDSARFYVQQALKQDPDNTAAQQAEQALALKLLDAVHAAINRHDFARASSWLDAAVGIAAPANIDNLRQALASAHADGEAADLKSAQERVAQPTEPRDDSAAHPAPDADAVRSDLAGAQSQPAPAPSVKNAAELELVKSVPPVYPVNAEKSGTEGWVELDFTVTESGSVKDATIHAAKPGGVFDQAATAAVLQWHYKPVLQDSKPVAQRARIRIRFALPR